MRKIEKNPITEQRTTVETVIVGQAANVASDSENMIVNAPSSAGFGGTRFNTSNVRRSNSLASAAAAKNRNTTSTA